MSNSEYAYTRMPWGKYKGRYLKEVPDEYLIWAANNWQDQGTVIMYRAELANRKVNWQQLEKQASKAATKAAKRKSKQSNSSNHRQFQQ
jgi:uncharacterized protein (DUF3820 family)